MLGLLQDNIRRALLHDAAAIHHGDFVSQVSGHGQVMRNEQIRHPERTLQLHQEIGDLRLHRTIESRERFIQNQELWLEGQRASDGQPLALTAAQLSGRPLYNVWRKTDSFEQGTGALLHFFTRIFALQNQRFDEYLEYIPSWVQRACGILKYELDLRANLTTRALPKLDEVFSFKPNVSRRRGFETGETGCQRALARSGFADNCQRGPGKNGEGHAIQSEQLLSRASETPLCIALHEIFCLQEWLHVLAAVRSFNFHT